MIIGPFEETHEGPSPYHPGSTVHRGRREDCSGPDCGPDVHTVPDGWGTFCPHGAHVVVLDREATTDGAWPVGKLVDPWPCGRCTRAEFEQAEDEAYENSLPSWEERYGL